MRWPVGGPVRARGRKSALAERGTWTLDNRLQPGPGASLCPITRRCSRINRRLRDRDRSLAAFHRSAAGFGRYFEAARSSLIAFCNVGRGGKKLFEIGEYR